MSDICTDRAYYPPISFKYPTIFFSHFSNGLITFLTKYLKDYPKQLSELPKIEDLEMEHGFGRKSREEYVDVMKKYGFHDKIWVMRLEYFGTNLSELGHYRWDLTDYSFEYKGLKITDLHIIRFKRVKRTIRNSINRVVVVASFRPLDLYCRDVHNLRCLKHCCVSIWQVFGLKETGFSNLVQFPNCRLSINPVPL